MKILNLEIKRTKKEKRAVGDAVLTTPGMDSTSMSLLFGSMRNGGAMSLSAVFRAVDLISDSIAMIPIRVCSVDETGHKTVVSNHPVYEALNDKNNVMTKYELVKLMMQDLLLKGNGYCYIKRNGDGSVKTLQYVPASSVTVQYNQQKNELFYRCSLISKKKIEPINMIHIIKNSDDGVNGKSVLNYANRTIQTATKTENSALNFFDSGCNLAGVLKVQGPLNPQQKKDIVSNWNQTYSGGGSGIAVLPGNMDYEAIQADAASSQLLESRIFNVSDIARFFGINPVLLGDLTHSSYSTLEAAQQEFLVRTIQPYIVMIEQELTRKCLKPSERDFIIDLDDNYLLRTDKTSQASYYTTLLNSGILSINEVRKELGYSEIENGDRHMIPYTDVDQNTIDKSSNNTSDEPTDLQSEADV